MGEALLPMYTSFCKHKFVKPNHKTRLFLKLKISGNLELGWHKEWSEICRVIIFLQGDFLIHDFKIEISHSFL